MSAGAKISHGPTNSQAWVSATAGAFARRKHLMRPLDVAGSGHCDQLIVDADAPEQHKWGDPHVR